MSPYDKALSGLKSKWRLGDRLTWSDEEYAFSHFEPDYPRAICSNLGGRIVAIDITTAKRVDPKTTRKRAERLRRKDAGEKRIECWLSADNVDWLESESRRLEMSVSGVVQYAVSFIRRAEK